MPILCQKAGAKLQLFDLIENLWWRRGELNPRPKVLYKAFYILSLVYWNLVSLVPTDRRVGNQLPSILSPAK